MNWRRLVSPAVGLLALGALGMYGWYTYSSYRVFQKALNYSERGHNLVAMFAHQVVLVKYPLSPLSTASRFLMATGGGQRVSDEQVLRYRPNKVLASIPVLKSWSPAHIDFYSWAMLISALVITVYCADLLGTRRRRAPGKRIRRGIWVVAGMILLYLLWGMVLSRPSPLSELVREAGLRELLTEANIAYASVGWASMCTIIVLWSLSIIQAGEPVVFKDPTPKNADPPPAPTWEPALPEEVPRAPPPSSSEARPRQITPKVKVALLVSSGVLLLATAGVLVAVLGTWKVPFGPGVVEWQEGARRIYQISRASREGELDESGVYNVVVIQEVSENQGTSDRAQITIRQEGGIWKPQVFGYLVDERCMLVADTSQPIFCMPDGEESEQVLFGGKVRAFTFRTGDREATYAPGVGLLHEKYIDKRGRTIESRLLGYQVGEKAGGLTLTRPLTCDWDGTQTKGEKLTNASDPEGSDRALARKHRIRHRPMRIELALSGTQGFDRVKVLYDRKRSVTYLRTAGGGWYELGRGARTTALKAWREPGGKFELLAIVFRSADTYSVVTLRLSDGRAFRQSYSFDRLRPQNGWGSVYIVGDDKSCILRLYRKTNGGNQVKDMRILDQRLEHVRGTLKVTVGG